MFKKHHDSWNQQNNNFILRFLAGIDFSLQVVLTVGVVILLCIVLFLIARDRFLTVNYLLAAIRSY